MPRRFYFPTAIAADVTPAANGAWTNTTGALNRKLVPAKTNSAITIGTRRSWTAGQLALDRRYVSGQLAAQTISGTVKAYLMSRMYAGTDATQDRLEIYVVSSDGLTVRGTLLAIARYGAVGGFVNNATHRNKSWANGDAISSLAIQSGDRLVVAIGYSDGAGTTPEGSIKWGDPLATADLPENETQTSDGTAWIEFSGNIAFPAMLPVGTNAATGDGLAAVGVTATAWGAVGAMGVSPPVRDTIQIARGLLGLA